MASSSEPTGSPRIVADVVCTSCGCLCDDIALEIEGDLITEARNACPAGRSRLVGYRPGDGPPCLVDGQPAAVEQGIERAARILDAARSPLVFGLADTTIEAQRAAVALVDAIGARVDVADGPGGAATMDALQAVGQVTATLGEIRNRADLIVVWRADPLETHPRLLSRHALDPVGLFVPGGRHDRYCVVVDVGETASVREAADQFIPISEASELEALWILRARAKGVALDPTDVETRTGIPLDTWQALVRRMQTARFGVLFYGAGSSGSPADRPIARGLHALARDLNATTRFVCAPLSPGGSNAVGARNVLAWQTGYPGPVDLSGGYPRYGSDESTADCLLRRGEVDAALIVSGDPASSLSDAARARLARIPSIVLRSDREPEDSAGFRPTVVFRTAVHGIHTLGTVYRMDGVPLPLRPILPTTRPRDEDVLRAIEHRLRAPSTSARVGEGSR